MKTHREISVDVPARAAFDFLAHVTNETLWRQSIVGSRYVGASVPAVGVSGETDVAMGSKSLTMRWQITEYTPGVSVAWELDGDPWNGGGRYKVTEQGERCVIRADLEVRLKGVARLLEPFVGLTFARGLRADMARLQRLLPSLTSAE